MQENAYFNSTTPSFVNNTGSGKIYHQIKTEFYNPSFRYMWLEGKWQSAGSIYF